MAINITRVTGLGGNPPTDIQVEGTATDCNEVNITTNCSTPLNTPVDDSGRWQVILRNSENCACGKSINVTALCTSGEKTDKITEKITLLCLGKGCPNVKISSDPASNKCVDGKRNVTLTVSVTPALTSSQALFLDFGDGTTGVPITAINPLIYTHDYIPSTNGYSVSVSTILPSDCSNKIVTHHVDVPACNCCPRLTLDPPIVSDCTTNALFATFSLRVSSIPDGCSAPSSFNWTVTEQKNGTQWFQTGSNTLDTQSGWNSADGNTIGSIDMNSGGDFSVSVVPAGNNSDCPMAQATQPFHIDLRCPLIIGAISASSSNGCSFGFSVPVENPCNLPLSFAWNFGDGATATTTVNTAPHTYVVGSNSTVTVKVIVTTQGCKDQESSLQVTPTCSTPLPDCPPGQHRDSEGNCVPDLPQNGDSFNFCAWLLVTAISLLIIGAVGVIVGVCLSLPWLWIAGAIVGGVGLLLFFAWVAFCSKSTPCSVMRTLHCILFWIIAVVAPIILVVAAILGGLPCALAAAGAWGGWGTLYAWFGFVMRRVGCAPTC